MSKKAKMIMVKKAVKACGKGGPGMPAPKPSFLPMGQGPQLDSRFSSPYMGAQVAAGGTNNGPALGKMWAGGNDPSQMKLPGITPKPGVGPFTGSMKPVKGAGPAKPINTGSMDAKTDPSGWTPIGGPISNPPQKLPALKKIIKGKGK